MILSIFLHVVLGPKVTVNDINGETLAVFPYNNCRAGIYPTVLQQPRIQALAIPRDRFTLLNGQETIEDNRNGNNRNQHAIFACKTITLTISFPNPFHKICVPHESVYPGIEWEDGERIDLHRGFLERCYRMQHFDSDGNLRQETKVTNRRLQFDFADAPSKVFTIADQTIPIIIRYPGMSRKFFLHQALRETGHAFCLQYHPDADDDDNVSLSELVYEENAPWKNVYNGMLAHYDTATRKVMYWTGWDFKGLNHIEVLDSIDFEI